MALSETEILKTKTTVLIVSIINIIYVLGIYLATAIGSFNPGEDLEAVAGVRVANVPSLDPAVIGRRSPLLLDYVALDGNYGRNNVADYPAAAGDAHDASMIAKANAMRAMVEPGFLARSPFCFTIPIYYGCIVIIVGLTIWENYQIDYLLKNYKNVNDSDMEKKSLRTALVANYIFLGGTILIFGFYLLIGHYYVGVPFGRLFGLFLPDGYMWIIGLFSLTLLVCKLIASIAVYIAIGNFKKK